MIKQNAKWNERLRKKLFIDEYSVFGQEFGLKLVADPLEQDKFVDDLCELLGDMDMYCSGGLW
ncbi:DUF469 family protein [Shewanella sp. 202IG2-18]|uniref:50S ribosome-binding protein YggL n=1 Tax=Parashewanella hymeniacidonis TaxID=2807618 RepID=UPI0019609CBE|nr:50S ribosome-binding protein YggL [Parashewanella hymeniacidonis]MBM7070598.1 DUF469 family protein [Parashewanella hymeniacidonis]